MKKNILKLSLIYILLLTSCVDTELDQHGKRFATQEQLQKLAKTDPEKALVINVGIEDGQYAFMRQFATNSDDTGSRHDDFGQKSIDLGMDLLSNDMVQVVNHWFGNYYSYRGRTQVFSTTRIIWNFYYKIIRNLNSVISQIDPEIKDPRFVHLRSRALALRAYCYFNLIRVYQYTYQGNEAKPGIPTFDGGDVIIPSRAKVSEVYDLILSDLETSIIGIDGFNRDDKGKIDKSVVAGIYARVLLETGTDWAKCISMAKTAKAGGTLISGSEWASGGFDEISSTGWLWGADIDAQSSTIYASFFSHVSTTNAGYAGLLGVYKNIDKRLYDAIPATDIRKTAFGADYKNYKFEDATNFQGDYVYMRVAEMYLIEAEAKARSGDDNGAADILYDLVSTRDSSYTKSTNKGQVLINEILLQRRIELWGEGFAWFDMKRTKTPLVRTYPGSNHPLFGEKNFSPTANEFLFQIPEKEIINNNDISPGDQNPL